MGVLEVANASKTKIVRRIFASVVSFVLVFAGIGVAPLVANAADLSLSPSSGSYDVGKTFAVNVNVRTTDQAMNAVSGTVTFPPDLLAVTSIAKSGSVVTLWVQEPSFSNTGGTVNFEGIVLNPGYTGGAGRVITINFRAKAAGSASVAFNSGSVLANDGEGTEILSGMGRANFTLGKQVTEEPPAEKPPAPEAPSSSRTPRAPLIASATHPNPEGWYPNNNPIFTWSNSTDTTAVNVLADRKPTTNPGTSPDGLFSTYRYDAVDEGAWFFHVRLKNSSGWGEVSHFRFQIDTEKPDHITIAQLATDSSDKLKFSFEATDKTSGIDHFEVALDNGAAEQWRPSATSNIYELATPAAGKHTLVVSAVDKAGNKISKSIDFTVEALVAAPVITQYPKQIAVGIPPVIAGTDGANRQVIIWLQKKGEQESPYMTKSDSNGAFSRRIEEPLTPGKYKIWAQTVGDNGLKSPLSEKVTMVVGEGFSLAGNWLVWGFAGLSTIMLALIVILLVWINRLQREVNKLKRSVYGVGSVKDAVRSAAMMVRRRATLVRRKKIIRPVVRKDKT